MAANPANDNLSKYKKVIVLRDGSTLPLRAIHRGDEERLIVFVNRLSRHTVYLRFHQFLPRLTEEEAKRLCGIDYDSAFALVVVEGEGDEERIIAVGRYFRLPESDTAEVAFVVEDKYQGKGIGTHLLEELALVAGGKGIRIFEALVLAENAEMLEVFHHSGFRIAEKLEGGVFRMDMDISSTTADK